MKESTTRHITIKKRGKNVTHRARTIEETAKLASLLARASTGGEVFALTGELGSGKTAFVKGFARALTITKTITSPTFVLMNIYHIPKTPLQLCHIDAYRLQSEQGLIGIGAEDYVGDSHTITLIEWADRVAGIIPVDSTWIEFCVV